MKNVFKLTALLCFLFTEFSFAQLGPSNIPIVTIAEAKELPLGTVVTLEGVTLTSELDTVEFPFLLNFRIEDESAAITVFGDSVVLFSDLSQLKPGDVIDVTGATGCFAGLAQINQLENPGSFSITDTGTDALVSAPLRITTTDLLDQSVTAEGLESKLVSLNSVTFLDKANPSGAGEPFVPVANYFATDGSNIVDTRVSTTFIGNQLVNVPAGPARIIGAFSQFSDCDPGNSGYQLLIFEVVILGDTDGNGVTNILDIASFVDTLNQIKFVAEADINDDGEVNLLDVAPFVDLLAD